MIPSDIKWDPNATPPQFTDNGDQVLEKGTQLRIKLKGIRSDVGSMFAIGSIKEDFLGYVVLVLVDMVLIRIEPFHECDRGLCARGQKWETAYALLLFSPCF